MPIYDLSPDTQAILLLYGRFGKDQGAEIQPLTLREYKMLGSRLHQSDLSFGDLLEQETSGRLEEIVGLALDHERVAALLARGGPMALAVEGWTSKGLWILGLHDEHYPARLKQKLGASAPPILYGVGERQLLNAGGLAIVGSRDTDEETMEKTARIARSCAEQGIQVVSGGARGIDQQAMAACLDSGGTTLGVLADSLLKAAFGQTSRSAIQDGRLTLLSPYDPGAGFNVGNAMGRNKYIYALADYAVVIQSSHGKGGTWAGAKEALSRDTGTPVFVWMHETAPEGNRRLVRMGATPFPEEPWVGNLDEKLKATAPRQLPLFSEKKAEPFETGIKAPESNSSPEA